TPPQPPSFLRMLPLVPLSTGLKSKMLGTAPALSCLCWSSQPGRKLSGVKCRLHRKEYLLGIQFSRLTARFHLAKRLAFFMGNLET
uniref:Uncharacterized protein n=1 Tax=Paramormyrops kingsleyae TaxID=1676925 RepID=A0A3B3RD08_9TELE